MIEGQSVIKNTSERGSDVVLNKNHYDKEAYGWFAIGSLVLKDDGIYASLELNNLGKEAVDNRHYRYLSPEFSVNQMDRTVHQIVGVGLVNAPNLLTKSLNKEEKTVDHEDVKKEMNSLSSENLTLKKENNNLVDENKALTAQIATLKELNKVQKIDAAISAGELLPAQKEFAMSLELNSLEGYLNSVKEVNKELTKKLNEGIVCKEKESVENNSQILKNMGW